ncbi:hypothetical protein ACIQZB_00570 [Streptomyces sp. NPDC097727]|uniref:hypothetical protein n=1 Tax=Streptomyces sp. NPDC097727 TaxID=3366092 RepID=UPI0038116343
MTRASVSDEEILRALLAEDDISNLAVATKLGCGDKRVDAVRKRVGLPVYIRGRRPLYGSVQEAFAAQTEPVEGGHLRWTGTREKCGTPVLRWRTLLQTAYRVAFREQYGREPVGKVSQSCGNPGCVAGLHQEDRLMREARKAGELSC